MLLVHDRDLLSVLDDWVASLSGQDFMDVLPLLRRTLSGFTAPERTNIARAVKHLTDGGSAGTGPAEPIDTARGRSIAHRRRHLGSRPVNAPMSMGTDHAGPPAPWAGDGERLRRWRLLLGSPAGPGLGAALGKTDQAVDAALAALYDGGEQ